MKILPLLYIPFFGQFLFNFFEKFSKNFILLLFALVPSLRQQKTAEEPSAVFVFNFAFSFYFISGSSLLPLALDSTSLARATSAMTLGITMR